MSIFTEVCVKVGTTERCFQENRKCCDGATLGFLPYDSVVVSSVRHYGLWTFDNYWLHSQTCWAPAKSDEEQWIMVGVIK